MSNYSVIIDKEKDLYKNPKFPFLVSLGEVVYEAPSTRDAAAAVINNATGHDYTDVEFGDTEAVLRILAARHHVMLAAMDDKDAIVWGKKVGRIKENYAASEDDPDYEDDFQGEPFKIVVDSDIELLKSLCELGTIGFWVREDFKDRIDAGVLFPGQKCSTCLHNRDNICYVYGRFLGEKYKKAFPEDTGHDFDNEGTSCGTYVKNDKTLEKENGVYINYATGERLKV